MKTYFISGIGADYRMFTHISLPDGFETRHIHWIPPEKDETIPAYARRLAAQIDTNDPFVLVGFSLGGIMATEIAKIFPPVLTILISSVPTSADLPSYYIRAHRLQLSKLARPAILKFLTKVKYSLTMRSREDRKIMRDVIRSGDDRFISWAITAVLNWKNETIPQPLIQIHGAWDEIFPASRTRPNYIIPKAGHTLVLSHAHKINELLRTILVNPANLARPVS
jgi:pimeloyl-ACP methyl ester carboxylesterase